MATTTAVAPGPSPRAAATSCVSAPPPSSCCARATLDRNSPRGVMIPRTASRPRVNAGSSSPPTWAIRFVVAASSRFCTFAAESDVRAKSPCASVVCARIKP